LTVTTVHRPVRIGQDSPTKVSPSRLRFRPPPRPAFRFRVRLPGVASTYSRPVLGAGGTLGDARPSGQEGRRRNRSQIARLSFSEGRRAVGRRSAPTRPRTPSR